MLKMTIPMAFTIAMLAWSMLEVPPGMVIIFYLVSVHRPASPAARD